MRARQGSAGRGRTAAGGSGARFDDLRGPGSSTQPRPAVTPTGTCPRGVTTSCKAAFMACSGALDAADLKLWAPEVALVRAQLAALEPRAHPLRVRAPARVLPLAGARQRARDAARGPARARRARAARAERLADRAGAGADPHRRRHVPQPRRAGRRRRAGRDRRALHVRQRLLRHRRQPPLRRPRQAGPVAGLHARRARRGSATTSGAAPTSSSPAASRSASAA